MAIKLDMSKTFDHLEWPFITATLKAMGFHPHFIELIQQCIEIVSYSVIVGGQTYGYFKPARGIRQGDPLSPFLFVIAMESFLQLLEHARNQGFIHGVHISRHSPSISSLFFADDVLLFSKEDEHHACTNSSMSFCEV
ncbi:hypothetical protein Cni_G29236 [Canna indica]|uniref:Reverse transcriptase domain-containing protein n=1 Tax=Canna indica TaxID=4628 RepID=A0AAQ3QT25_9LILI|nr:hypothetical protein Cni_G29236 [Canna indica]